MNDDNQLPQTPPHDHNQNRLTAFISRIRQWSSRVGWLRTVLAALLLIFLVVAVFGGIWLYRLDRNIQQRFAEKRFAPPVEFYSAPEKVRAGSLFPKNYFENLFARKNFRRRSFGQPIQEGDYSVWSSVDCGSAVPLPLPPPVDPNADPATVAAPAFGEVNRCIAFKNTKPTEARADLTTTIAEQQPEDVQIIALDGSGRAVAVYKGAQPQTAEFVAVEPELFAQYYGENPVLRNVVTLGTVPTQCLNALLAIEDAYFLDHPGISVSGLLRAVVANLRAGRKSQGGSTITQQLVKNYFLTEEKTWRRKFTEIAMAVLVERHATKDDILETYINLIYMGQNGPFQVRGFAAASEHYFGKPVSDLTVDQCATLAAILNSPGLYDPFRNPERALKRRTLVLDRMVELKMIEPTSAVQAKAAPLPTRPPRSLTEPAPYFVQAVRRELVRQGISEEQGLRVYTSLNLRAQEAAYQAVRSGLERLEKNYPLIQKLKAQKKNLEAVLVSADPYTGAVEALVGGRGYLATQFNRAVDSHRQVGSIMKPFVYLTAFENNQPDGAPYTPLTLLKDTATTHRFEGQRWTPRNYDGTYHGDVPLYWALKESQNAATVNLGMAVGIDNIVETVRRFGVRSPIRELPSLTLGAFDFVPIEVLQSYSTFATMGRKVPLTLIQRVEDLNGGIVVRIEPEPEPAASPDSVAELVGVMKQTVQTGTGRAVRLSGFTHPAAGKTGTTNDKKDAWFAGFTPYHAAIVWVGYDDNTSHNLTGGSGAVPIWTSYMKAYGTSFPAVDFPWPEAIDKVVLSPEQQLAAGAPTRKDEVVAPIELIFKKGQVPDGYTPAPPPGQGF